MVYPFQTQSTLVSPGGRGGGKSGRADIIATFMSDYLEILEASTFRSPKDLSRQVMVSFTFDVLITKYQTGGLGHFAGPSPFESQALCSGICICTHKQIRKEARDNETDIPDSLKHYEL